MLPYIATTSSLTAYVDGKPLICSRENIFWDNILHKIENNDSNGLEILFNMEKLIVNYRENVVIDGGIIIDGGKPLSLNQMNELKNSIIKDLKEDLDIEDYLFDLDI